MERWKGKNRLSDREDRGVFGEMQSSAFPCLAIGGECEYGGVSADGNDKETGAGENRAECVSSQHRAGSGRAGEGREAKFLEATMRATTFASRARSFSILHNEADMCMG